MSWIESSDVIAMFPSLVWKIQIREDARQAIDAPILEWLHRTRPGDPGQAWQSAQDLHRREELRGLVARIDDAAASILRFLRVGSCDLVITGCWANVLPGGTDHRRHSHPNNFLSGVYYLRTAEGANTINFHDPRPQTDIIRPPVVELTRENTDLVVVTVTDGTLLLFPSWLAHSVDANRGDGLRISVSFNLMFASFAEELAQPLW